MLKGLERRYTFEEIEAQDVALIKPRLNYNALNTLRNPMYVKFAQQVGDASKDQHEARTQHIHQHQHINNIAHKTGLNEAELQQLFNGFFAEKLIGEDDDEMPPARGPTPEPPERGGGGDDDNDDNMDSSFNDLSNFKERIANANSCCDVFRQK